MANASGLRSPTTPRSEVSSPRPKFDSELLKAYMKKLLSTTLGSSVWPEPKDRDRVKSWMKEIGDRVKDRMLEIQPKGFKYIVLTQVNENLGQGGRFVLHFDPFANMASRTVHKCGYGLPLGRYRYGSTRGLRQ